VLALPFLVMVVASRGLTAPFPAALTADESASHYPTILRFAAEWPRVDLTRYHSVTTPLFHLLMAGLARLVGGDLFKLRLANALIAYLAVLAFHRLLRVHFAPSAGSALLQALVLALIPYGFANSFVLMTDPLAWLLWFGAMHLTLRLAARPRALDQALLPLCFGAAVLTRQSSLALAPLILVVLASRWGWRSRRLLAVAASLAAAALPYAALVRRWGGSVPVEMAGAFVSSSGNPKAFAFMLCVVGLYLPFYLVGLGSGAAAQPRPARRWVPVAVATAAAAAFLIVAPMRATAWDFGVLWRLAAAGPSWRDTSPWFWVLLPAGLYAVWLSIAGGRGLRVAPLFLLSYGLPFLISRVITQRHFETAAIVFLSLALSERAAPPPRTVGWSLAALALVAALFDGLRYTLGV